jgi:hypothetical protein
MNTKTLNSDLIEAMKGNTPAGVNLANLLMNTLGIGKEAVYRRLRDEVPFTFEEASLISRTLQISLDRIASVNRENIAICQLHTTMNDEDPIESYYQSMNNFIQNYDLVKDDPGAEWYMASNTIPMVFFLDHEYLSKFLLYKWIYQQDKISRIKYYRELEVPETVRDMQLNYTDITKAVSSTSFIWDNMMFLSLINDIRYFCDINLITDEEKELLKKELSDMIDILEDLATKGEHENGNKVFIYISTINFEATYSYLYSSKLKLSFIRLFSINTLSTTDKHIFEYQRDWIQSLKKYATLISVSGEMQRIQFFEKQRMLINKL